MCKASVHEQVGDQLVRPEVNGVYIVQRKEVFHSIGSVVSKYLLRKKYQSINNNQVLDHWRDSLKIAHSNICHPEKFWRSSGMFRLSAGTLTII
jgi:hypothetical protein